MGGRKADRWIFGNSGWTGIGLIILPESRPGTSLKEHGWGPARQYGDKQAGQMEVCVRAMLQGDLALSVG